MAPPQALYVSLLRLYTAAKQVRLAACFTVEGIHHDVCGISESGVVRAFTLSPCLRLS